MKIEIDGKEVEVFTADDVSARIDSEVSGLKDKNAELLEKLTTTSKKMEGFEGLDPKEVKEIISTFNQSEEAQLIKDGKLDEVLSRRMDKREADFQKKINDAQVERDNLAKERDTYADRYNSSIIDREIQDAAAKAGVLPEAIGDVVARSRGTFQLDKNGNLEARDADGRLVTAEDGGALTPAALVASMKKSNPYYWPGSVSAESDDSDATTQMGNLNKAAAAGDMTAFRKMRGREKKTG